MGLIGVIQGLTFGRKKMGTIWALQGFIIDKLNLLKCSHGTHIGPTRAKINDDVPILVQQICEKIVQMVIKAPNFAQG